MEVSDPTVATLRPPTLYSICLRSLTRHSKWITSLDGVPYVPYGRDLVQAVLASRLYINASILRLFRTHYASDIPLADSTLNIYNISLHETHLRHLHDLGAFITRLNLSASTIDDQTVCTLNNMTGLLVLDLSYTQITDVGISHIVRPLIKLYGAPTPLTPSPVTGMPDLRLLNLSSNPRITDLSLKSLHRFRHLVGLDLSDTRVNPEVARAFLRGWTSLPETDVVFPRPEAIVTVMPTVCGEENLAAVESPTSARQNEIFMFVIGEDMKEKVGTFQPQLKHIEPIKRSLVMVKDVDRRTREEDEQARPAEEAVAGGTVSDRGGPARGV
ncbi:hypothetical protein BC938DRAFT_475354 [Jimgerdemannia flammicorona]|uniref:Uncharacterized protein n=1 Tax=Jimgerdemannia flammicorona TaxID=994334 RepID=A0A433PW37_9FUNG|nr:hypothetical protein BC938DRAFT_475354 [Jimgerdemannia flammicorona]